mmetsp:Transcript_74807/g.150467  ORF Transcript_74807/g.150467 Transcript_74807/m.150467 type:complete len:216 (-) Transcript_74807:797-1444(-)
MADISSSNFLSRISMAGAVPLRIISAMPPPSNIVVSFCVTWSKADSSFSASPSVSCSSSSCLWITSLMWDFASFIPDSAASWRSSAACVSLADSLVTAWLIASIMRTSSSSRSASTFFSSFFRRPSKLSVMPRVASLIVFTCSRSTRTPAPTSLAMRMPCFSCASSISCLRLLSSCLNLRSNLSKSSRVHRSWMSWSMRLISIDSPSSCALSLLS